jgi:hypothetical protein
MIVIVDQLAEWTLTWEGEVLKETCPIAILSTTNSTWPDPDSIPDHGGGKLAPNIENNWE